MIKESYHSVIIWESFTPCNWWNLFSTLLNGFTFCSELTGFISMSNGQIVWCWKWPCRFEIEWFHTWYYFWVYFHDFTRVSQLNQKCFTNCSRLSPTKNKEFLIKKLEISKIWWWRLINFTEQKCKLVGLLWSDVFVYLENAATENTPNYKMSSWTCLTFIIKILSEFLQLHSLDATISF